MREPGNLTTGHVEAVTELGEQVHEGDRQRMQRQLRYPHLAAGWDSVATLDGAILPIPVGMQGGREELWRTYKKRMPDAVCIEQLHPQPPRYRVQVLPIDENPQFEGFDIQDCPGSFLAKRNPTSEGRPPHLRLKDELAGSLPVLLRGQTPGILRFGHQWLPESALHV
jgi:hypothetical protein